MRRNTAGGKALTGRTCAPCNLCCIHLEIESRPGYSTRLDTGEELAKGPGYPCPYLTRKGCSIYDSRPLVCRQFACDWLIGEKTYRENESPLQTAIIGVRGARLHLSFESIRATVIPVDTPSKEQEAS
jgi:Fe-S-cluster containining protein